MNEEHLKRSLYITVAVLVSGLIVGLLIPQWSQVTYLGYLPPDPGFGDYLQAVVGGRPRILLALVMVFAGIGFLVFHGLPTPGLQRNERLFYLALGVLSLVVWSPSKALAYLSPFALIAFFLASMALRQDGRVLQRTLILVAAWGFLGLSHAAFSTDYSHQNVIISFFTYGSFFPLLVLPLAEIRQKALVRYSCQFLVGIGLLQAVIGIVQGVYGISMEGTFGGNAGDYVEGTIHLALAPSSSFTNPMFAFNMMASILAALYLMQHRPRAMALCLALFATALTLTIVAHLIVIFGVAFAIGFLLCRPNLLPQKPSPFRRKRSFVDLVIGLGFPVATLAALQWSWTRLPFIIDRVLTGENQKTRLLGRALFDAPAALDYSVLLGAGPGQFASRAAAISAGYLGTIPPPFSFQMTAPFRQFALDLWLIQFNTRGNSSLTSPASSWTSLISEFGVLGFLAVTLLSGMLVLRAARRARRHQRRTEGFLCITAMLTLFTSGLTNFYWETPQAIFLTVLMAGMMYVQTAPPLNRDPQADV